LVALGGLGNAGGSAASSGSAGSMNIPPDLVANALCDDVPALTSSPLIDDLDDGDAVITPGDGRVGYWFTFHDGTQEATQEPADPFLPAPGGRSGSAYAAHTRGSGFSLWGAGMGLSLHNKDALTCGYDASRCGGVSFWAKSGSTVPDTIRLRVATAETTPYDDGGSCGTPYETWCHNDFGIALTLTADWKHYDFDWNQLTQERGWGLMTSFNPERLVLLQWQVPANASFDFWIDDVTFADCRAEGGMAGAGGND
jgi:hypothetical protein